MSKELTLEDAFTCIGKTYSRKMKNSKLKKLSIGNGILKREQPYIN